MLGTKDYGILVQIIKRSNRIIEKIGNIGINDFSNNVEI